MAQAYPQFTPVQILEAGERAIADGRREYATQFFQHLVDHHADTPEAAKARDVLARLGAHGTSQPSLQASPQYVNVNTAPPQLARNPADTPLGGPTAQSRAGTMPRPVQQPQSPHPQPNTRQPEAHRHPGLAPQSASPAQTPLHAPQGRAQPGQAQPGSAHHRQEPAFSTPSPMPDLPMSESPGHLTRHQPTAPPAQQHSPYAGTHATAHRDPTQKETAQRLYLPAPEKHYIVGRVISGLMLLIGIIGVFAGIGLIFAAFSDPKIFAIVGATTAAGAVTFALSVFVGSMALLVVSQVATAVFNGADAVGDLARLERFRAGDYDDEED